MAYDSSDLLQTAISAIQNEPSTPGPTEAVSGQTLQRMRDVDKPARSSFRPIYTLAASILMVLGFITLLCLLALPAKPELTWGEVLATINQANTMTARMQIRIELGGNVSHAPTEIGKVMIKFPGLRREMQPGWIYITNWPARKRLNLNTREKIATISDLTGQIPSDTNPIQTFDELKDLKNAQHLAKRQVDGIEEIGFRFHHDSQFPGMIVHDVTDIWADAKTHRIIECVIDADTSSTFDRDHPWDLRKWRQQKAHLVMDQFQWDVPLDDSLFSIIPPAGYKIVHGVKIQNRIIK